MKLPSALMVNVPLDGDVLELTSSVPPSPPILSFAKTPVGDTIKESSSSTVYKSKLATGLSSTGLTTMVTVASAVSPSISEME